MFRMQSFGNMLNGNILFCTALPSGMCDRKMGPPTSSFPMFFLLLETERKRKKERTTDGGEG
jgi:hypothetical protein